MSSANHKSLHIARAAAPFAAAIVLITLGAMPSSARPDSAPHIPPTDHLGGCQFQRVGTQFVRCDNLTGNGVAAPAWIPRADSPTARKSELTPRVRRGHSLTPGWTVQHVTHVEPIVDVATPDAHVAVAVSDRITAEADGTLLPGDVRVWELNHPAAATPSPLPGDPRHRERGGPADLLAPAT